VWQISSEMHGFSEMHGSVEHVLVQTLGKEADSYACLLNTQQDVLIRLVRWHVKHIMFLANNIVGCSAAACYIIYAGPAVMVVC
jgi:hypothetical protein